MSERQYQDFARDRANREYRDLIRAEPDWRYKEDSKAWLEKRYPLLDDTSSGSPLFRYMKAWTENHNYMSGRRSIFYASMLSFYEMLRYSRETGLPVGFDNTQEKLYPDYRVPDEVRVPEPNWRDLEASRTWLEQLYPLGPFSIGSALYRYMQACLESRHPLSSPTTYLGTMLSNSEWKKFRAEYPNSVRHNHRDKSDPSVLYAEYDERMWPRLGPGPKPANRPDSSPGLPHLKSVPPPVASPPMFAESYPPHLRRQPPSSNTSNKRKNDDEDDAFREYPSDKRRRNPSDLSGGELRSAKQHNPYGEGHVSGSMAPPPHPHKKAAGAEAHLGATSVGQWPNDTEHGSSSRQDTIIVTGIAARTAPRQSSEMEMAGSARQHHQSVDTPKTGGLVQTNAVANKLPALAHSDPMIPDTRLQNAQQTFSERKSETGGLSHQPYGQDPNSPILLNDSNAAHKSENKNPSPLPPELRREDQANVQDDPDAMDIDSDEFGHQTTASPNKKTSLANSSKKRSIEDMEDEQPASSPSKRRRASPDADGDDSLLLSSPMGTQLADSSTKSSAQDVEHASPESYSPKSWESPSNLEGNELPTSSASTETLLGHPSRKRSIEDVEDVPPTSSTPKRQRTPPSAGGDRLPPSSPFDPPEESTPTRFPHNTPTENEERGEIPSPASLRQESPSSNDVEGPALQSASQSEATDGGRSPEATNTDNQQTTPLRDDDAAVNGGSGAQELDDDGPVPPESESQYEHHLHKEQVPDDIVTGSEQRRDQMTTHVPQNSGDRTEQKAISVIIPLKIPRRQPAANQELLPDEDTTNVPVVSEKRKRGRKPGPVGRKILKSEPQRKQGKREPPTKGRKTRQAKPKREQQAYVGRLRSGVGEREHKKPRLVVLEFKGRKGVQVRAN